MTSATAARLTDWSTSNQTARSTPSTTAIKTAETNSARMSTSKGAVATWKPGVVLQGTRERSRSRMEQGLRGES